MAEFHRGPYETAVGEAELLTEIRIPVRPGGGRADEEGGGRVGGRGVPAAGRGG